MALSVAFLSTDRLEGFFVYDQLSYAPLLELGVVVQTVSWRATDVDWNRFDAVVVRSTWDYQDSPLEFLATLERIERSRARLFNPLALMRWNLDKRYLLDLQRRGVEIVPTRVLECFDREEVGKCFQHFAAQELVVKPTIGANADGAHRLLPGQARAMGDAQAALGSRAILVQPFLRAILEEGEYSLFYFGGRYSHAILKAPAAGDFRVQEEHGGSLRAVEPERALRVVGDTALEALPGDALYARLDFVRGAGDRYMLMEAELIEPSLYFQLDGRSPARFAEVLHAAIVGRGRE